ncbi:MAG: YfiT family bacillithiol transferase [Bryobacteraceae bacterium]
MNDLRYPVGEFRFPDLVSAEDLVLFIRQIAQAPADLRRAVAGLTDAQLDTPYRPRGWTVRQLAHHVPDSHINSYTRFRLALTEQEPVIKPYDEKRWAELPDSRTLPVEMSLALLENLHARWVPLLRSLSGAEWKRCFRHPELGLVSLENNAALYAWHGRHHVAHITALRSRMGW